MSGPTVKGAIETVDAQTDDDRPAFYGINCSHPLEFMPAIEPGAWFERVRCLRPNAAMMDKISLHTAAACSHSRRRRCYAIRSPGGLGARSARRCLLV